MIIISLRAKFNFIAKVLFDSNAFPFFAFIAFYCPSLFAIWKYIIKEW